MPLIKNGQAVEDRWITLDDEAPLPASGDVIVSLARFTRERDMLMARAGQLGVQLASCDDVADIAADLADLSLVALDFPRFADGRAYSSARLLRQRYGFDGELRAVGDVLPDQLAFMARCGFDAFVVERDDAPAAFARALTEIGPVYQTAADGRAPVWARRMARYAAVAAE